MNDHLFDDILPSILRDQLGIEGSPGSKKGALKREPSEPVAKEEKMTKMDEATDEGIKSVGRDGRSDFSSPSAPQITTQTIEKSYDHTPLFGCPLEEDRSWSGRGILGRISGQTVKIDLQYPKLMAVFGQIRSGKSYLAGVLTEMSAIEMPRINRFLGPRSAVIIFNYRKSREARFEYWSFAHKNDSPREIKTLEQLYGVSPQALNRKDLQICAYSRELQARRDTEYAGMESFPLLFKSSDLEDDDWMLLMGLPNPDTVYIQVMRNIVEDLGYSDALSLENIRIEVNQCPNLKESQKNLANLRLDFAKRYVDDLNGLNWEEIILPGTVTIVDLRRRQGKADDALRLCLVVLSAVRNLSRDFHKFVLFDEFHEYYDDSFSESLDNIARMAGHHNWSLCLATQNTHKVDMNLLRLFTNKFVFQVDSATWNNLTAADERLRAIEYRDIAKLQRERGECYALLDDCTDSRYAGVPIKLNVRPRLTKHGGTTAGQD